MEDDREQREKLALMDAGIRAFLQWYEDSYEPHVVLDNMSDEVDTFIDFMRKEAM